MDIGPVNFGGIYSGIDSKAIIQAILNAERQPEVQLQNRQAQFQNQRTAFDDMRSKLAAFSGALSSMSADITFRGRTATVSNDATLRATAGASAETGVFSIEVLDLAAAHKVRSAAVASVDQGLVTDGTITLRSGSGQTVTVNVSAAAGNNSLAAVRDAINAAQGGVSASVVNDGPDARLVVRSDQTGVANALTITDSTNLGLAGPGALVTAAADARVSVDGVASTSSTNHVTGLIPGITLDLIAKTLGTPTTVEIAPDKDAVVKAVQSLVTAYNDTIDYFNTQFSKDKPGPLAGDSTAREAQRDLQSIVTGGVEGIATGNIRSLSSIGVSFDGQTGKMSLDTTALTTQLDAGFDNVARMFINAGSATDPRIRYDGSSFGTQAGNYAVTVTQAAQQAVAAGSAAINASGLGADEALTIGVGGGSTQVALTAGMTIAQVVDAVNAGLRSGGVAATASNDAGRLRITSRDFGTATSVSVTSSIADSGNGSGTGFGTTATTGTGVDIAGTLGGVAATGAGQVLTGATGGPYAGLSVRATVTAADIAAANGNFGSVSFSQGLIRSLTTKLDGLTQSSTGPIATSTDALDAEIKRITDDIAHIEDRLSRRQTVLTKMFGDAENAIAALQAQQAQLASKTQ